MEFISQYQYPLIGLGILVIMGLVGYLADQKETGKIAESKKLRQARLEEKKKLKEQQKAEKKKLQEEKMAEKAKQKEEKMKAKENEKTAKEEVKKEEAVAVVSNSDTVEEPTKESSEEQTTEENTNSDVFIIEEPTPAEDTVLIEEEVSNENPETENVIFEPAVQVEEKVEPVITETGEDLSVPFAFASSSAPEEKVEQDVLKSESSMAFNSLLEEVQAEEASMNSSDEDQFLQSINMVSANNSDASSSQEEDEALKVFMRPAASNNEKNDMTSDNLDAWKL